MPNLPDAKKAEQFGMNRIAGECLKSKRRNEFLCRTGHNDMNVGSRLDKEAQEFHGFIGSDATGNAENDNFSIQHRILDPQISLIKPLISDFTDTGYAAFRDQCCFPAHDRDKPLLPRGESEAWSG